ncbi:ATP-binding protein [Thermodesulfobacteriota bacterium B35]
MSFLERIKVPFWDHRERVAGAEGQQYIFRNKWKMLAAGICLLTLVPLGASTLFFYQNSREQAVRELLQETRVFAADTALDVYMFLKQYIMVLQVIGTMYGRDQLVESALLAQIFASMAGTDDAFIHLDVLGAEGHVLASRCIDTHCRRHRAARWIDDLHEENFSMGHIVSEGGTRYLFVRVRIADRDGSFFYLRGLLPTGAISGFLDQLELEDIVDVFIVDSSNRLLTESAYFGASGDRAVMPEDRDLPTAIMVEHPETGDGRVLFVGADYIGRTAMKLGLVVSERNLEKFRGRIRRYIFGLVALSTVFLLLVVFTLVTYVVQKLYQADLRRREYLDQVARSDKLASIGRLAAGVAHEINNPLAIINEKAGLLQDLLRYDDRYREDERLLKITDDIIAAVQRAGTITHRLLGFARKMDTSVLAMDVEHVVREVVSFVRKEAEYKDITIAIDVAEDVPEIISDRGKLQQILLNLINNAIAAMDRGGRLEIRVRNIPGEQGVVLSVSDNGCGISEENQKKVFEPFFSTRTRDGGTGLGLAITYGLVRDLRGSMELESVVGEGTTFTITLPYEIEAEEE